MKVLIVECDNNLGGLWQGHLERAGMVVSRVADQGRAIAFLSSYDVDVIVMNLVIGEGSALAIADYASYRHPEARIIFVTNTSFFSDGSIFSVVSNACAFLPTRTPPDDLTAMVEHHGHKDEQMGPSPA